jgi:hypothetical protein
MTVITGAKSEGRETLTLICTLRFSKNRGCVTIPQAPARINLKANENYDSQCQRPVTRPKAGH